MILGRTPCPTYVGRCSWDSRYGEKVDAQAPELLSVEYSPVQGEYGRPYEFIFHYRDRSK